MWPALGVAIRRRAEACIQAAGGHMEHLLLGNMKNPVSQIGPKDSGTMLFRTYVDIKYFYYSHVRNLFLKLCCVSPKRPVY
jgi:hypothetical protein